MPTRTAIVILNWNGEKFLRQFLPTLVENTNPDLARICIIDNGSTDGSLAFLVENFSQIQLVKLDKNYGFAGGYNRGLKEIDAEYFMLLNSDVEVGKDWITPLVELMDSDRADQSLSTTTTATSLNTQVLLAAISTNTAIRFAVEDFSSTSKPTTASTTHARTASG